MKTKKLKFTVAVLASVMPAIALAEDTTPRETTSYPLKTVNSTSVGIINRWMYDNSLGNPIDQFAQYPQFNASMMVYSNDGNSYLYIPKFKEEFPSDQQLYVYDAASGAYLGLVTVAGLDKYQWRLFEDVAITTGVKNIPVIISGYNTRIDNEEYISKLTGSSDRKIIYAPLDLSDPLNPKVNASDILESVVFSTSASTSTTIKDSYYKAISVGHFFPRYTSNYLDVYATSFIDVAKCSDTSSSVISTRLGLAIERFRKTSSAFNHAIAPYKYNANAEHVKSQACLCVDGMAYRYVAKQADLVSDDEITVYNPILFNAATSEVDYVANYDFTTIESGHSGDAIASFTLEGQYYIIYASRVDTKTQFTVAHIPDPSVDFKLLTVKDAEVLWQIPQNGFETTDLTSETGENISAVTVVKTEVAGYEMADIYLYAQGQALASYRMGYASETTGVDDVTCDQTKWSLNGHTLAVENAQTNVHIYNTQGALVLTSESNLVDLSGMQHGIYIARAGSSAYKFTLK